MTARPVEGEAVVGRGGRFEWRLQSQSGRSQIRRHIYSTLHPEPLNDDVRRTALGQWHVGQTCRHIPGAVECDRNQMVLCMVSMGLIDHPGNLSNITTVR